MFSDRSVGRYVREAQRVGGTSACNLCSARLSVMFALIIPILLPAAAHAQASISGTVTDASRAVLPGATVEASSPALIEKARVVVTDAMGLYRIVDLRPGIYTVTFMLTGFNTFQRQGIELTGSFNASVNAELKVGGLEQQITVTGESPIVDVQNVQQQRVVNTDVINKLPSARTPLTLAALIPGMKNSYDITPTFGGPVVRDKLWFFVAARSFGYENYVGGMFFNRNSGDLNAWTYVPDSGRPAYNLSQQRSVNGRATWQINNRHKVSASFEDQWRCACYNNVSGNIAPEAASEYYYPISIVTAITWTYPMSNRLLLQAAAAIRREDYEYTQRQAKVPQWINVIPVTDTFTRLSYRGP